MLLTATIKSTWAMRRDFIVLILSLDISGAYYYGAGGKRWIMVDVMVDAESRELT